MRIAKAIALSALSITLLTVTQAQASSHSKEGLSVGALAGLVAGGSMTADITGIGRGVSLPTSGGFALKVDAMYMASDHFGVGAIFQYQSWSASGVDVNEFGVGLGFRGMAQIGSFSLGGGLDLVYSMATADALLKDTSDEFQLYPHVVVSVDLGGGVDLELNAGVEVHPAAGVTGTIGYPGFVRFAGYAGIRYTFD